MKQDLRPQVAQTVSRAAAELERTGLRDWSFGALPDTFTTTSAVTSCRAIPRWWTRAATVAVRVLDTRRAADQATWQGTRRLLLLAAALAARPRRQASGQPDQARTRAQPARQRPGAARRLRVHRTRRHHRVERWTAARRRRLRAVARHRARRAARHSLRSRTRGGGPAHRAPATSRTGSAAARRRCCSPAMVDIRSAAGRAGLPGVRHGHRTRAAGRRTALSARDRASAGRPGQPTRSGPVADESGAGRCCRSTTPWRASLPPARRDDAAVTDVRWMIEELRVSLFAQTVGTPAPVSEKRIRRAMSEAFPG